MCNNNENIECCGSCSKHKDDKKHNSNEKEEKDSSCGCEHGHCNH